MSEASPTSITLTGHCLCGKVSITLEQPRTGVEVCHCRMCQRWGGGPFFNTHSVKQSGFALEGAEHVAVYRSSEWAERAFCKNCGSNLYYHYIPGQHYSFLAGLFDLPEDWQVDDQIFVDEQPQWAELASDSPRRTGAEVIAEAIAAGHDPG